MGSENNALDKINETLKKIEGKIEDNSPSDPFSFTTFMDYEKRQEKDRREREEERREELLQLQRGQTSSIKNQENFNKIIAFTGAIIALTTIYTFIVQSVNLKNYSINYWIITVVFLCLILFCLGTLVSFIVNFRKMGDKQKK